MFFICCILYNYSTLWLHSADIRIYAPQNQNKTLAIFWLDDGAVTTRGLIFAELYRHSTDGWKLTAHGEGIGGRSATEAVVQNACKKKNKAVPNWKESVMAYPLHQGTFLKRSLSTPPGPRRNGMPAQNNTNNTNNTNNNNNQGCCVLL